MYIKLPERASSWCGMQAQHSANSAVVCILGCNVGTWVEPWHVSCMQKSTGLRMQSPVVPQTVLYVAHHVFTGKGANSHRKTVSAWWGAREAVHEPL